MSSLRKQVQQQKKALQEKRQKLVDAESQLAVKHEVKRFSLEQLGDGRRSCGGGLGKMNRIEVLKRMD